MSSGWSDAELLSEGYAANASTLHAIQFRARLTNHEAAELCGVTPRTYRRWLTSGRPNAGAVRLLAVLAGYVPLGWLVGLGGSPGPAVSAGLLQARHRSGRVLRRHVLPPIHQDRPDFNRPINVVRDPLSEPLPVLEDQGSSLDHWYVLGYRYAYASNRAKAQAGIPRYWEPSPQLSPYLDGKEDRRNGRPARCAVLAGSAESFRAGPIALPGSARGGKKP